MDIKLPFQLKNPVILASGSPRRQELMRETHIPFTVLVREIDESFPETLSPVEIAEYLAAKKAAAFQPEIKSGNTVITADTIVSLEGKILNKAADESEAFEMIKNLSGKTHEVITGVCICSGNKKIIFSSVTEVEFKELTDEEIQFYVRNYKPFDKAGAYGIQEWIGLIAVQSISGSYFNVVGLPVAEVYSALKELHS